nr:MAG TPA: hypothetical protein [Caudoviricetes sp.]DAP73187.1 MAG TPA: hypothetical protein [Caudoviricetes sp.]
MVLKLTEKITDIKKVSVVEHNLNRINHIKEEYKSIRQDSKGPTFALT